MPVRLLVVTLLAIAISRASAQSEVPTNLEAIPEPPPLPAAVESGEFLEPDVRIIQGEQEVITEYVVGGRLRAIKVRPRNPNLPAYYLVDTDGDGRLDRRTGEFDEQRMVIPHWVLFSW